MCYHNDFMKLYVGFQPHIILTEFSCSSWVNYGSWVYWCVSTDGLRTHYFGVSMVLGGLWKCETKRGWFRCVIYKQTSTSHLFSTLNTCESAVTDEHTKTRRFWFGLCFCFCFSDSSTQVKDYLPNPC